VRSQPIVVTSVARPAASFYDMDAAFMLIKGNAAEPTAAGGAAPSSKPDSGHANTISITHGAHRTNWNAMKPRIQCVLTP